MRAYPRSSGPYLIVRPKTKYSFRTLWLLTLPALVPKKILQEWTVLRNRISRSDATRRPKGHFCTRVVHLEWVTRIVAPRVDGTRVNVGLFEGLRKVLTN